MVGAGRRFAASAVAVLVLVALAAAGMLVVSAGPAAAQAARTTGEWKVGPVQSPDGQFLYCRTENEYSGGLVLGVVRNAQGEFVLLVGSPRANVQPGATVNATLSIDGGNRRSVQGRVNNPNIVEFVLGRDDGFYGGLMRGSVLTLQSAPLNASFRLSGTMDALTRVRNCVAQATGQRPAASAPRRASSGGSAAAAAAAARILPPAPIFQALRATGTPAVVPLSVGEEDAQGWGFGPVVGIVQEIKQSGGGSIQQVAAQFHDRMRSRCKGSFDSGLDSAQSAGGGDILPGWITCDTGDNEIYWATVFFQPRGSNRPFLFRYESTADNSAALLQQRNRLVAVMTGGG